MVRIYQQFLFVRVNKGKGRRNKLTTNNIEDLQKYIIPQVSSLNYTSLNRSPHYHAS
jgi:hypothetical protein